MQDELGDLAVLARGGDGDALEALVRAAAPRVQRWALVQTGDADAADDVTQEVLIRMVASLDSLRQPERIERWLYAATRNAATDLFRKSRRNTESVDLDKLVSALPGPPEQHADMELRRRLVALFRQLPRRQREVFDLVDLQGLTAPRAAGRPGQPAGRQRAASQRRRDRHGRPRHHGVLVLQGVTMDMRIGLPLPLLSLLVLIGGCEIEMTERGGDGSVRPKPYLTADDLDTRTFAMEHISGEQASNLVGPYVYADRPRAPGAISWSSGARAITVRETPDNLDKFARMLEQIDVAPSMQSYRLHFQVVAPNGSETDVRLAPVEEALRKVFRFDGYALVGEGYVTVSRGDFNLTIDVEGTSVPYEVDGLIFDSELSLAVDAKIERPDGGRSTARIDTRLGFRSGQTLVLGSMPAPDQTVFVVVHVAEADTAA